MFWSEYLDYTYAYNINMQIDSIAPKIQEITKRPCPERGRPGAPSATFREQQRDGHEDRPEGKGWRHLGKGLPCRNVGLWSLCQPRLPLPLTTLSAFSWGCFKGPDPLPQALEDRAPSSWRQAGPCPPGSPLHCLPWASRVISPAMPVPSVPGPASEMSSLK